MSTIALAVLTGIGVLLAGNLPWAMLFAPLNLRFISVAPWAVLPMGIYLWCYWQYIGGNWGSKETAGERRAERALTARVQQAGLPERTIRNAVDTLVELTHNLGLATIGNQLYISGLSNLFGQPEFLHAAQVRSVAQLLDNLEPWLRETAPNQPLSVYIGQENPIGAAAGCSLIISRFRSSYSDQSYIGVLGPTRQSYRDVMQLVAHAGKTLEEVLYE